MTAPDRRPLPKSLTRLQAGRPGEPTPEERSTAGHAAHAPDIERWRVRGPSPAGRRTSAGFAVAMGMAAAVIAALTWRMLA